MWCVGGRGHVGVQHRRPLSGWVRGYWLGYRCGDAPKGWGFLYQVLLIGEWYAVFWAGSYWMARAAPVFAGAPAPTGIASSFGI